MNTSPEPAPTGPQSAVQWMEHGHACEAEGRTDAALDAYDHALATLASEDALSDEDRRTLSAVWACRGNALQRTGVAERLPDAVQAYDKAIAILTLLPLDTDPALRNQLGAAWMNRGHALMVSGDVTGAQSFAHAIAEFEKLPLEADPYFRLNLAGAWTNLAHATLAAELPRAHAAAVSALDVLRGYERIHEAFAGMSLRAARVAVMATGELLRGTDRLPEARTRFVSEATDMVDEALALARDCEERGTPQFRPIAARLYQMGAHLYRVHQPHFLAEFLLDHLAFPAFSADTEFRSIAKEALELALSELQRPQLFVAGMRDAEKMITTARSLRAAQQQLANAPA